MKCCKKCDELKPLTQFARSNRSRDGYNYICRDCDNYRRSILTRKTKDGYRFNPLSLTTKKCATCKTVLPVGCFSFCKSFKDGFQSSCKQCRAESARQERSKYRDQNDKPIRSEKRCSHCKETKPIKHFYTAPSSKDGYQHKCKRCGTITRYKITVERFNQMLCWQNERCGICETYFDFESLSTTPCIDHCHSTNIVRGLLCTKCNTALGMLRDDPILLQKAIQYLTQTKL